MRPPGQRPNPKAVSAIHIRLLGLVIVLGTVLLGCSHRDPIDRLIDEMSHETVLSHPFRPINLLAAASPEQVVAALSKSGDMSWEVQRITSYKIVEIRAVHSGPHDSQQYTAVLLDTNVGQKIVLLRPLHGKGEWSGWYHWTRDVK
jgi:hypothetical protein